MLEINDHFPADVDKTKYEKALFLVHHIFQFTTVGATYIRTQTGPATSEPVGPYLETRLSPAQAQDVRGFLTMIAPWPSEKLNMFATLYAAWNDLLIWQMPTSDDTILAEAIDNWHPDRQLISKPTWVKMLNWMREVGFVPTGFGNPTRQIDQPRLSLD